MRPASEAERRRLNDTFAQLCAIESPFGREGPCAERVAAELRALGLEVEEDDAARPAGAECGNLLARVPGRDGRSVLLCAHLDTVALAAPVEPVLVDEGWENARDGILGADNKAAVAVLIETARRCAVEGSPVGIELLFTVSEENALAGAKAFDVARLRSEYGYVFDHAPRSARSCSPRRPTTAWPPTSTAPPPTPGSAPRTGAARSLAAARAVAAMPLGRLDEETTASVSSVHGGEPGTTNVVPDRCRIEAETRSLDRAKIEAQVAAMVDAVQDAANATECDVDTVVEQPLRGLPDPARRAPGPGRRAGAARVRLRAAAHPHRRRLGRQRLRGGRLCVHQPGQRDRAQPRARPSA